MSDSALDLPELEAKSPTRIYCRDISPEGYECTLYLNHTSPKHKGNHLHHEW